jgi:hypothetical protein
MAPIFSPLVLEKILMSMKKMNLLNLRYNSCNPHSARKKLAYLLKCDANAMPRTNENKGTPLRGKQKPKVSVSFF